MTSDRIGFYIRLQRAERSEEKLYDVFFSYARRDGKRVLPIVEELRQLGLSVFFDQEGIDGGSVFPDVISDALDNSKCVISCWSAYYFTRPWCLIESREGLFRSKLVPIAIENFERERAPADLRYVNYLAMHDAIGPEHAIWGRMLERVHALVREGEEEDKASKAQTIDALKTSRRAQPMAPATEGEPIAFVPSDPQREAHFAPAVRRAREAAEHHEDVSRRFFTLELPYLTNWTNPQFVVIPNGKFRMGGAEAYSSKHEYAARELPAHTVSLAEPFALGVHPVTVREFQLFVKDTGRKILNGAHVLDRKKFPSRRYRRWLFQRERSWQEPGFAQTDFNPVVCISLADMNDYIEWLNRLLDLRDRSDRYRLPSEAEWEYACRAGTTSEYSFGDEINLKKATYFDPDLRSKSAKGTCPVDMFPSNAFGLKGMHGNVWEMCADWWNSSYHGAPYDGSAWCSGDPDKRVIRGGSWASYPNQLRSSEREQVETRGRFDFLGFRLARSL